MLFGATQETRTFVKFTIAVEGVVIGSGIAFAIREVIEDQLTLKPFAFSALILNW